MKKEKIDFFRSLGFNKEADAIEKQTCPFCGKSVSSKDFKDQKFLDEFNTSGLCKKCQLDFFKDYEKY
jgi:hypothetical protein